MYKRQVHLLEEGDVETPEVVVDNIDDVVTEPVVECEQNNQDQQEEKSIDLSLFTTEETDLTVSYTHLDVYKRQKQSIYALHPTYQFHNQMDSAFANMDSTTQDFAIRLNRCMAVAMGESTLSDVTTNIIDEKIWFSFVSNKIEYHILSKESYNEVFAG